MTAIAAAVPTLYRRRLAVTTKTASGILGQFLTPTLWVLIVAPALDTALGGFDPSVDYFTFVAVGQVVLLVPFVAMFNGLNVIVDRQSGIMPELLVAPIRRAMIPLTEAMAVVTLALAQVALIVALAIARGADLSTSPMGVLWFVAGAALLTLTIFGVAEILALRIGRQEAYGPLIPAIGVTPYFFSGALFPIGVLPAGIEHVALVLPWTHALALLRHGVMQDVDSGLYEIWHLGSETVMAWLSLTVLAALAALTLAAAVRVFHNVTTS